MPKKIIFSGIQPTGNLHIGNYLGAVKHIVELQNSGEYEMYYFIADYHSLTGQMDAATRRSQIITTAAELIAAGIDPKKTTLFVQSHVPEHTELAWIFQTLTPVGELKRMTQWKDKISKSVSEEEYEKKEKKIFAEAKEDKEDEDPIRYYYYHRAKLDELVWNKVGSGLFTYPVLQAADVLLYHATHVPVGEDQKQHVELTRNIAQWFNKKYGDYFPEPQVMLTKIPRVKSLLEPEKKMSKSLGQGHVIELGDEPEVIEKKLKRAVTATEGGTGAPGAQNLLLLLKEFSDEKTYKQFVAAEKDGTIRYGELKQAVASAVADAFIDFRKKRKALLRDHGEIAAELMKGAKHAQAVATKTMSDVRTLVGIR